MIIIDEANRLAAWKDTESLEHDQTRAAGARDPGNQRHISDAVAGLECAPSLGLCLCAPKSSTDQFVLAGPIKGPFRSSFVVGNLSREEAHTFFLHYVLASCEHPLGASEAWQRVYEVCGGNPNLLQLCASKAAAFDSWELGARFALHTAALQLR